MKVSEEWQDEWVSSSRYTLLSWDDLALRRSTTDEVEQELWRRHGPRARSLTDKEMLERGLLLEGPASDLFHIAYIPWTFPGGRSGKNAWSEDDWSKFRRVLKEFLSINNGALSSFLWQGLTLESQYASELLRLSLSNSHLIGDIDCDRVSSVSLSGNLVDGSYAGQCVKLENCWLAGCARVSERTADLEDCRIGELNYRSEQNRSDQLNLKNCDIDKMRVNGFVNSILIDECNLRDAKFIGTDIGNISVSGGSEKEVSISLFDSNISGRFSFSGVKFVDRRGDCEWNFEHAKFMGKVRIIDACFALSILSDAQFDGPIDIEYAETAAEDVFETELSDIRKSKGIGEIVSERRRRKLERACQLICDRHRQDGRRDLEHRFRRMELKARAYRQGADNGTKFLSWSYEMVSDFGRSFFRPMVSLSVIWLTFFAIYLLLGGIALGLPLFEIGSFNREAVVDAALLSIDKTFPFGASVEEADLFDKKLIGSDGGASAFFVGALGAFQTVLSGLMVFLAGLAIRTKLLIG